jgi:PAS domain S-box-containing protein
MDKLKTILKNQTHQSFPKILMVDDKEANLIALKKVLKNENAELILASNGNDALQLMLKHEFALALLDVQMPDMDGYELAEIMRSDDSTASIPIIFISAIYTNKLNIFKGFEMGAFSFITKPFEPIELLNKVHFFLEKFITEKAYDESRNKYMDLYNNSPDMLISVNVETSIIKGCNKTLLINTGYDHDELIGKSVYILYSDNSIETAKLFFKEFKTTGKSLKTTLNIKTKHGVSLDVLIKTEEIKDLNDDRIICNTSLSDISELNKIKIELQKTLADLEKYNEELKSFVYLTSHDLQEPLVTVHSFLNIIKSEYEDVLNDTGKEYIQFAMTAADRMKQMVTALLEYLRLGQTHTTANIDFNVLLKNVLTQVGGSIQKTNAKFIIDELPTILINEEEMEHLFQNLISNAIKFKKPTVNPIINISVKDTGEFWEFSVSDNGIGIEEKQYGKLFKMFRQLHQRGEYAGIGVGLPICKKIVEKNGGEIWVESEVNRGTKFMFTIPKVKKKPQNIL